MSTEISVNEDVKALIDDIISKHKLPKDSNVTYNIGSEIGDGYLSKTVAVSINGDNRTMELFLKYGLDMEATAAMPVHKYYATEMHFYDVIYPAYLKFVEEKKVENGFQNIPKCYGTSNKNVIALENIKKKGYALCNRRKPQNDKHISLVLKFFAKFHAISFAFKDQSRKKYDELIKPTENVFDDIVGNERMEQLFKNHVNEVLAKLDPVKDKHILNGIDDLANKLVIAGRNAFTEKNEDAILTQGDCWCNNMMFLYEDENKENPVDIMFVDWQITRPLLPIIDLSYFFYTMASQEALNNLKHYMKEYHEELSRQIRKLGSDPDTLYPFALMEKQWKEKSKFGLYMAFSIIRLLLSEKDETVVLTDIDFKDVKSSDFFSKIKSDDEYFRRMKILLEHMVANQFV